MASRSVTIIDYGIGNLRSLEKALQMVGADVERTDAPEALARAERAILPGVGAFGACAAEIRKRGLEDPIRAYVQSGRPLLGVCVGMQLLFEQSAEQGVHRGLGLLPGTVQRFAFDQNGQGGPRLKVPHIGWNAVQTAAQTPLLAGLDNPPYFYFVHSFFAQPDNVTDVLGTCEYGTDFAAIVGRDNVMGVQFHPEKSQRNGLRILQNFSELS